MKHILSLLTGLLLVATGTLTTHAEMLAFSFSDPEGDSTSSSGDLMALEMMFDTITGDYAIALKSHPSTPFLGEFRINIHLFNPDTGTTARNPSHFADTVNDYDLAVATTEIILTGTNSRLTSWDVGDRVAANGIPFGNPDGIGGFNAGLQEITMPLNNDLLGPSDSSNFAVISQPSPEALRPISVDAGQATLTFETEIGRCYELWASEDLTALGWSGPIHSVLGTGSPLNHAVPIAGFPKRFFQLRSSDLAPTEAGFAASVTGTVLPGTFYHITSSTEFVWNGEPGEWAYLKTGNSTATIVFTYDEDDNNPAVYREVFLLEYTSKGAGTFRHSEYNGNVEDGGSIALGGFSFGVPSGLADLSVVNLTHDPSSPVEGTPITFTAVVKNLGNALSLPSDLELRVGGESPGKVFTIPALAPAASYTVTRQETLPAANYLNTATADFNADVAESNEGNNVTTDNYVVTSEGSGFAPDSADFTTLVVGTTLPGSNYQITSPTDFFWLGEPGEWSYTKTGPNTATLIFTYDEDGNNPGVYKEQFLLTYTAPGLGTFRHSEFNFGTEDAGSVQVAPFNFN